MKKVIYSLLGLTAGIGGATYYLTTQTQEKTFPAFTFYYKEISAPYTALGAYYADNAKKLDASRALFDKGELSQMAVYYDNPDWLKDPSKTRTAMGYHVADTVPTTERLKIGTGLSSIALPSFKALTMPTWKCEISILSKYYIAVLYFQYLRKYKAHLNEKKTAFVPCFDMFTKAGNTLSVPVPSAINIFDFIKTPRPELNEKGQEMVKKFGPFPGTTPAASEPKPAVITKPAPIAEPKVAPAKPVETPKPHSVTAAPAPIVIPVAKEPGAKPAAAPQEKK